MDTANITQCNNDIRNESNESDIALRRESNTQSPNNDNYIQRNIITNANAKALRASEKNQKVTSSTFSMQLVTSNVDSDFISCLSSNNNSTDEIGICNIRSTFKSPPEGNDYVNFTSNKSFLKVDLKSAVYSHSVLSIWVKITYRIYEKISEKDWIGLYYNGK